MSLEGGRTRVTTARLILRDFVLADAAAMFAVNSDPEVARFTGDEVPTSVADTERILATHPIADYAKYGYGRWACELRSSGEVIGFCGLKFLAESQETDVGYRLARAHWGQGYATEGAIASVRYGFETLGLSRIIGMVMPGNLASIRVLEKVGLRRLGLIDDRGVEVIKYAIDGGSWGQAHE